jgi:hypothetical protein
MENESAAILSLWERIIKLEEKWKTLSDFDDIKEIHRVLGEHHNSIQILKTELKNTSPIGYFKINEKIEKLNEKIEKLEDYMSIEDRISASDVLIRIYELEKHVKNMTECYIRNLLNPGKPHRCPVCDGNCMRPNPLSGSINAQIPVNLDCIVCEGKGIVWV